MMSGNSEINLARLEQKADGIIERLDRMNGAVARNAGEIADLKSLRNDVEWMKKFFWAIVTTAITAIVMAAFAVILK